jgi:uncharacterized protein (DUF1499 family)
MSPPPQPKFVSLPPNAEDYLVTDSDNIKARYHTVNNILCAGSSPGLTKRQVAAALHRQIEDESATFVEAERHEPWRLAMLEEINSIKSNKTWWLVPLPPSHHPIGLKWVFKLKKNAAGEVEEQHKARLVVKGVNFEEVFTPMARIESVRLLLALAAQEGWPVHHMDVKSAFLNGELAEEVYVHQPLGFIIDGEEDKVLRLDEVLYRLRQALRTWNEKLDKMLAGLSFSHSASKHAVYARGEGASRLLVGVDGEEDKVLYRLRQAPHTRNEKLDKTLVGLSFCHSASEHAVYAHGEGTSRLLVGVYVDDLIITGNNAAKIAAFKKQMSSRFNMSDLGLLCFCLGIEVQ